MHAFRPVASGIAARSHRRPRLPERFTWRPNGGGHPPPGRRSGGPICYVRIPYLHKRAASGPSCYVYIHQASFSRTSVMQYAAILRTRASGRGWS